MIREGGLTAVGGFIDEHERRHRVIALPDLVQKIDVGCTIRPTTIEDLFCVVHKTCLDVGRKKSLLLLVRDLRDLVRGCDQIDHLLVIGTFRASDTLHRAVLLTTAECDGLDTTLSLHQLRENGACRSAKAVRQNHHILGLECLRLGYRVIDIAIQRWTQSKRAGEVVPSQIGELAAMAFDWAIEIGPTVCCQPLVFGIFAMKSELTTDTPDC